MSTYLGVALLTGAFALSWGFVAFMEHRQIKRKFRGTVRSRDVILLSIMSSGCAIASLVMLVLWSQE